MMFWSKLKFLLPWKRRSEEQDMQEELESLKAMAERRELGNFALAAEDARAVRTWTWLEQLAQDIRYAFRAMRRSKAFSLLAVLSLALGIGANTAIYSFMDSILLRPLPVPNPESLVVLKWRTIKGASYSMATKGFSWSTDGSHNVDDGFIGTQF